MKGFTGLLTFFVASPAMVSQSLAEKNHKRGCVDCPVAGVRFPTDASSDAADYMPSSTEEGLIKALETDDQVTVVGNLTVGVLNCENLDGAEDTTTLEVAVTPKETIVVERTSFTFLPGDAFDDGVARKVWAGEELVKDILGPKRMVTIAWGEVCNVQTFLFKVITPDLGGRRISVIKSVPCIPGASTDICVVKMEVLPKEEDRTKVVPIKTKAPKHDRPQRHTRSHRSKGASRRASKQGRQLLTTTTVDVMYLYTEGGKDVLGGISDAQMQTTLAAAIASANEAMTNSDIDLTLSLVYTGSLPYDEDSTSSSTVLDNVSTDDDVADLRDIYEADLVQVAANLGVSCGRALTFSGSSSDGYSVTNPICFNYFSHTHEMGHNFGCYHNREDTTTQTGYAHGYRYCDTTDPYRTIMSYPCTEDTSVPRVNWFSNPDVVLLDKASGTSDNDCALAIEESMVTVSGFRPAVVAGEDVNPCLDSSNNDEYRCSGRKNGKTIDLNGCELTDTEADLLRACFEVVDVTRITKIKLNVNSFTSLPDDLFDDMGDLATLNLKQNCGLTCVPPVPSGTNVILSGCISDIDTCDS
ncbi:unnamed protein product [Ascophyllum nodosum]